MGTDNGQRRGTAVHRSPFSPLPRCLPYSCRSPDRDFSKRKLPTEPCFSVSSPSTKLTYKTLLPRHCVVQCKPTQLPRSNPLFETKVLLLLERSQAKITSLTKNLRCLEMQIKDISRPIRSPCALEDLLAALRCHTRQLGRELSSAELEKLEAYLSIQKETLQLLHFRKKNLCTQLKIRLRRAGGNAAAIAPTQTWFSEQKGILQEQKRRLNHEWTLRLTELIERQRSVTWNDDSTKVFPYSPKRSEKTAKSLHNSAVWMEVSDSILSDLIYVSTARPPPLPFAIAPALRTITRFLCRHHSVELCCSLAAPPGARPVLSRNHCNHFLFNYAFTSSGECLDAEKTQLRLMLAALSEALNLLRPACGLEARGLGRTMRQARKMIESWVGKEAPEKREKVINRTQVLTSISEELFEALIEDIARDWG